VHLGNASPCSKLEFATAVAKTFGVEADKLILPTDVEEVGLYARRPHKTTLNCARAEGWLGQVMPNLKDDLIRLRELLGTDVVDELLNEVTVKINSAESAR
jgi:dTDP-4-dehydrorhamnose reductase